MPDLSDIVAAGRAGFDVIDRVGRRVLKRLADLVLEIIADWEE